MTEPRLLRIGVLGAGQIAQAAHFESCVKARNAELYAICDVAEDLLARMTAAYAPRRTFTDYDRMLADPELEAVIIATADVFHVEASIRALEAGKHVLCEKPIALSVEDAERVRNAATRSGRILQIGHMKRYDGAIEVAKDFIEREMGGMLSLKAWYCDSTHRYVMTDAVQPTIVKSSASRQPPTDPHGGRAISAASDKSRAVRMERESVHLRAVAQYACLIPRRDIPQSHRSVGG
jgi:predicted dehydrogenase